MQNAAMFGLPNRLGAAGLIAAEQVVVLGVTLLDRRWKPLPVASCSGVPRDGEPGVGNETRMGRRLCGLLAQRRCGFISAQRWWASQCVLFLLTARVLDNISGASSLSHAFDAMIA